MQFSTSFAIVALFVMVVLGLVSVTESNKNSDKKPQFRGNTNYQHFLELEQKRKMKSNELEQQQRRITTARPVALSTRTTTTTTTTTTTIKPPTVAPKKIISRRLMAKKMLLNNSTISAATTTTTTGYKEVIRRKKKASVVHLDRDNEIQSRDEREEELPSQRFLAPSVRKYLALGRAIPGRPGTDYPILAQVPYTNFYCDEQEYPGFFADMETRCQGWHYCDIDGRQATFLCPNGTMFSQAVFVCDWWFNVPCDLSPKLYSLNARLYQRPKTSTPPVPHRIISKVLIDEMFN